MNAIDRYDRLIDELYEELDKKVVQVRALFITDEGIDVSEGTGTILLSAGGISVILTCGHVVEPHFINNAWFEIMFPDGTVEDAFLITDESSMNCEIGLLYTIVPHGRDWPSISFADPLQRYEYLKLFMSSYAYGDRRIAHTEGVLIHHDNRRFANKYIPTYIEHSIPTALGSSGAAVVNKHGELVAVHVMVRFVHCSVEGVLVKDISSEGPFKYAVPAWLVRNSIDNICDFFNIPQSTNLYERLNVLAIYCYQLAGFPAPLAEAGSFAPPARAESPRNFVGATIVDQSVTIALALDDKLPATASEPPTGATIVDQSVTIALALDDKLPATASEPPTATENTNSPVQKAEGVVTTMLAKGFVLGKDALNKAKGFDEKHLTSTASATVASLRKREKKKRGCPEPVVTSERQWLDPVM